jgi:hypothetical protein
MQNIFFWGVLKMEAIRSSETSVKTGTTRCYTPEEDILHSHRRENLKFYKSFHVCICNRYENTRIS